MAVTAAQPLPRRRPSGRAARLVLGALAAALLLPAEAGAIKLWERKKRQASAESGEILLPSEERRREGSGRRWYAPWSWGDGEGRRGRQDGDWAEPGAFSGGDAVGPRTPAQLSAWAAEALGAPAHLPGPVEVANYPHELRRLEPAHGPVLRAASPAERAAALVDYGNVLAELSRDGAAALAYRQALDAQPGLAAAWNNLGSLARRAGRLGLSRSLFEHVLRDEPESGLAWFNLALTLEALGDWDGADAAYVKALNFAPELWTPALNPMIVGNERAQQAVHRRYLERSGRGSIVFDRAR